MYIYNCGHIKSISCIHVLAQHMLLKQTYSVAVFSIVPKYYIMQLSHVIQLKYTVEEYLGDVTALD